MVKSATVHRSRLWYVAPILLGVVGGFIAYYIVRDGNPVLAKNALWIGVIISVVVSAIVLAVYWMYNNDISAARQRISTDNKVIDTRYGQIEYADVGDGSPILAIHGTGGGFDQGLLTSESFFDSDIRNSHRVIAPSRFGYLQTPMPPGDASPAAQADAHAALLDQLGIDERVAVIGASAGAVSAAEFAVKYPDRVSTLLLAVPASWSPATAAEESAEIGSNNFIMDTVLKSDFIMWAFTKIAGDQMLNFVGVPQNLQQSMTSQEREDAERLIDMILPVSQRYEGIRQDAINHENRRQLPLESISAPTIIVDAKDVVTFPGSKYTAEQIPNAKLITFETGGHLLIGHGDEARAVISDFVRQHEAELSLQGGATS
jgi:2-hydroxy-6-oxonona-2,4-dienedioate hydrolase